VISLSSAFFYTNGYTHVTIATVSISDNIAAGKIILQLADNTWSMRNLAKRVVIYSVTITTANSLSTNHKEYQNAGNPKNTGPYGPPRNNSTTKAAPKTICTSRVK
jgi:hypothetical protein